MLVVLVVLVLVVVVLWRRPSTTTRQVNGKWYVVLNQPHADESAETLAALETRLAEFLELAEPLAPGDARLARIRARWKRHATRGGLGEADVRGGGDVAYTESKDTVYVCVRDPASGRVENVNNAVYVLLHELAHVCTTEFGHTATFWANFRFLLELAERTGTYTYADHAGTTYCGHPLGENVVKCVHAKTCDSLL